MLDAAAYVPTQPLDLSVVRPDFVSMSFYKIFGYPTGLGALIVSMEAAADLKKVRVAFWGVGLGVGVGVGVGLLCGVGSVNSVWV